MELTPGRVPFSEQEEYTPLRKPKSIINNAILGQNSLTIGGHERSIMGLHSPSGSSTSSLSSQNTYSSGGSTAASLSPSKLSPFAKEFVPRFGNSSNSLLERIEKQQQHQMQYNQQTYQQYQQPRHQHQQQQQQQQQRYSNGYVQNHYQQQYSNQMATLTTSVQDRLKVNASGSNKNPSNYGQQGQSQHYQSRNHKHNYQQQHQNQRYQQQQQQQQQQPQATTSSGSNSGSSSSDVESLALNYLQTVIQCLNQTPGQFDTIATRFLTIFDGLEDNQFVLCNAMEDIFQESIQNANFRYMGAKLYNLLHMLNLKKDSLFHTLLKCKLDFHQQEIVKYMQNNKQHTVRETALFLAELYMQLRGDDSRIHLIAENIVYSLKQLLQKENMDNIRCICLTLKLAGYDLTADCPQEMQDIIAQLETINAQTAGKYPLITNVITLQKNNWGRKLSSSNSLSESELTKPIEPLRTSDEPIFYGPDGRELTAEESDFLSGGATASGGYTDEEDAGELDDLDPEMDEETEKAYMEFCKLNATV